MKVTTYVLMRKCTENKKTWLKCQLWSEDTQVPFLEDKEEATRQMKTLQSNFPFEKYALLEIGKDM